MDIKYWILRRLLLLIFVLWGVTTLVFIINTVVPRNPAMALAGSRATEEQIEKFNIRWGLDKPIAQRYLDFYRYLLQGDLGTSIRTERPVLTELKNFFPATFELATVSMFLILCIGIPLGVITAAYRGRVLDQITRVISLIGVSTPNFWFGLLFLYYTLGGVGPGRISSLNLEPTRITGLYLVDSLLTGNWASFKNSLQHIICPAIALSFFGIGVVTRMMRSAMIDTLGKEYITAAKSRGFSTTRVIANHALKNSLIPVVTVIGVLYGKLLGGAIVIEVVFSWPGLGNFAYESIFKADAPAIMGVTLIIAFIFSLINMAVDLLYRVLDPRIRM